MRNTGLEHLRDKALLKALENCDGTESPIIIECLRRLLSSKINLGEQYDMEHGYD
jgi:hypothetical protein